MLSVQISLRACVEIDPREKKREWEERGKDGGGEETGGRENGQKLS